MSLENEVIAGLLEGGDVRESIEEAIVKKKKVRDGKVTTVNVNTHKKKKRASAARKRAIKKAHKAAQKASANKKRKRSLNVAKRLKENLMLDEEWEGIKIVCPECGTENLEAYYDEDSEQTLFTCADCGKTYMLIDIEVVDELADDEDDLADDDSMDDEDYFAAEDGDDDSAAVGEEVELEDHFDSFFDD